MFLVVNQKYKVQVHDEYVMSGNTAVLKCQVIILIRKNWTKSNEVLQTNAK